MSISRTTSLRTTPSPGPGSAPGPVAGRPVPSPAGRARAAVPVGVAAATAVNLGIYGLARLVGGDVVLLDGGDPHHVAVFDVVSASVLPLGLGLVVAAVLALRWPSVTRLAQVVGGGAGIVTAAGPLVADADWVARISLAAMHVVVGVTAIVVLEVVRRHRAVTSG